MRLANFGRLVKIFLSYKRGKESLNYLPIRLWIEPTTYCNLKCVMCPNKDLPKSDKGNMDFELYKKLIDEVKDYAYDIALNHRGESLLHAGLFDMISYARENDLYVKLHTNATLLNRKNSEKLIMSGLNLLSFSFDGYSKEIYENLRNGANFERTLKNIEEFVWLRENLKEETPYTVLEVIDFENYPKEGLKKYEELGVDELIIKKMHNWGGSLTSSEMVNRTPSACTFPWYSLTILWDGSVVLCPQDFFGVIRLGNIRDSTLKDIWNGEEIKYVRRKMATKNFDGLEPCNKCDRIWREKIWGVPKEFVKPFLKENILGYRR
ncbi:MAG: radical SAM/SPASM domain-containing protein [Bacteroidales bacterium]